MSGSLGRVLVVTVKPRVAIHCHTILRQFEETAYSVSSMFVPEDESGDSRLVILDADSFPDWMGMVREASRTSRQLFVIVSRNVSPKLVYDALAAGVHGLLSTALSTEEAGQALSQIRQGRYTFRFEREPEVPQSAVKAPRKSKRRARWSCVCLD